MSGATRAARPAPVSEHLLVCGAGQERARCVRLEVEHAPPVAAAADARRRRVRRGRVRRGRSSCRKRVRCTTAACAASADAAAAAVNGISHRSSCALQARAPRAPATADASGASVQLSLLQGDGALEVGIGASTHAREVGCRVLYVCF